MITTIVITAIDMYKITANHQALFIYNRTKIIHNFGMISGTSAEMYLKRLAQCH